MTRNNEALATAKRALQLIGEFGTPPTPEIFEVWYSYVEGSNRELVKQLDYLVKEAKSVNVDALRSLHQQFCVKETQVYETVGQGLATELMNFQSLVVRQEAAGTELGNSLSAANELLVESTTAAQEQTVIDQCVTEISRGALKMQVQLDTATHELTLARKRVATLQSELATAQRGMMTDHLTGIGNRRFFDTLMHRAVREFKESECVYLLLMDIDYFKSFNDTYGHVAGDELIRFVATRASELRPDASVARLGGDEFAVFLRVNDRDEVLQFTERLRDHLADQRQQFTPNPPEAVTFSIGVARLRASDDATSWYQRTDKMLYSAKELGKNRAVIEKSAG